MQRYFKILLIISAIGNFVESGLPEELDTNGKGNDGVNAQVNYGNGQFSGQGNYGSGQFNGQGNYGSGQYNGQGNYGSGQYNGQGNYGSGQYNGQGNYGNGQNNGNYGIPPSHTNDKPCERFSREWDMIRDKIMSLKDNNETISNLKRKMDFMQKTMEKLSVKG